MEQSILSKIEQLSVRISEVRYTDLEQELMLCQELLSYSLAHGDSYGRCIALTYLGDYYLATCQDAESAQCLFKAESLLCKGMEWDCISLQLYKFLGIYHDLCGDEQSAVDYYLKAIIFAEKLQDSYNGCGIFNNLAYIFFRHHHYQEAFDFLLKAFQWQSSLEKHPFRATLLANLAELSLHLHKKQDALRYLAACEQEEELQGLPPMLSCKEWCSYYIDIKNKEKATLFADRLFAYRETINLDRLSAFEYYYTLCIGFTELGDEKIACRFLQLLEKTASMDGLGRRKRLEEARLQFTLQFEPAAAHTAAYCRFYKKDAQFRVQLTNAIAEAMKSKIYLEKLTQQAKLAHAEQESLTLEVSLDELTGIYNRRYFEQILCQPAHKTTSNILGIIIFDVDYFKEYNDHYGHLKGDHVLQEIGACLKEAAPEAIIPCRYGGDEFACVCLNLAVEKIEQYIQNVQTLLQKKAISHEKSPCSNVITLSIGYVVGKENAQIEGHLLFQLADQALYQSKRSGRNTSTRNWVEEL